MNSKRTSLSTSLFSITRDLGLPIFKINDPSNVIILDTPTEFYNELLSGIKKANKRICLGALYVGQGEAEIVSSLSEALKNKSNLDVHVLVDYFRGQRKDKSGASTASILQPLVNEYSSRIRVSLFQTPVETSRLYKVLPQRWNEIFGVQHIKVYLFDNDVMLSGANMSRDYFENRQDRYILFRDCPKLANYFSRLLDIVSEKSYTIVPAHQVHFPKLHPPHHEKKAGSRDDQCFDLKESLEFLSCTSKSDTPSPDELSTWVSPVLQLGYIDLRQEEYLFLRLLDEASDRTDSEVILCSGYFNLPPTYQERIVHSTSRWKILTSSPQANGFFGSKGMSGYIPHAYSHAEHLFYSSLKKANRLNSVAIYEYLRKGWTWHGKGLWIHEHDQSFLKQPADPEGVSTMATWIGSSNLNGRSIYRDLEASALLVTSNSQLIKRIERNTSYLFQGAEGVTECAFHRPERLPPLWLRRSFRLISSML